MSPVVIVIGEHPQESTAFHLGKVVYERLRRNGYDVFLERMPVELTPAGSAVKGLEPADERISRLSWLRGVYERHGTEAFYFPFHNWNSDALDGKDTVGAFELCRVDSPPVEEFRQYRGVALEIPAVWKRTKNRRLMEHARAMAEHQAGGNLKPGSARGYLEAFHAQVVDFEFSSRYGFAGDSVAERLVAMIMAYMDSGKENSIPY